MMKKMIDMIIDKDGGIAILSDILSPPLDLWLKRRFDQIQGLL